MRREDGQTAAEYMGILLLVAAIIAVVAPGIPSLVSGRISKIVGGAAAGVGAGAIIWWGAKLLSPACGPFAPVCAIAF